MGIYMGKEYGQPAKQSGPRNQYSQRGGKPPYNNSRPQPKAIEPVPLPKDFVEKAERVMSDPAAEWTRKITTSKIRRLFSLFTDIYNVENRRTEPALTEENVGRLRLAQIRMLYEAGRDRNVKDFLDSAGLVSHLKAVGTDRDAFICYFHYMEALVAYHKYFGGREG